jgi:methylmalonic aciduria homocystinuria type C protein
VTEATGPLLASLKAAGLDLAAPFDARAYNVRHPDCALPLPAGRGGGALALVIGNTRALWAPFLSAFHAAAPDSRLATTAHPLDTYVEERITAALAALAEPVTVHLASTPPPHHVAVVTAAELSGLAFRAPSHLAVHPEHGPWIGLRAVLVFDRPPPPEPVPAPACMGCTTGCAPAFERARTALGTTVTAAAVQSDWRRWVAVRDACPVGGASRFSDDQIGYHYTHDRKYLGARG